MSFKNRHTYLKYYWENLKLDMSKIILSDKHDFEASKQLSILVFGIKQSVRDHYIILYSNYCRLVYFLRFLRWRMLKLKFRGITSLMMDWDEEIPKIIQQIKNMESELFSNIDPFAAEIFIKT